MERKSFTFSSIWTEANTMLRPIIHRNIFLRNVCSQSFQNIFLCRYFCVRSVFVPNKFISALTHWLDQRVINTISGWAKEDIIKKTIELDKYEIIMRILKCFQFLVAKWWALFLLFQPLQIQPPTYISHGMITYLKEIPHFQPFQILNSILVSAKR